MNAKKNKNEGVPNASSDCFYANAISHIDDINFAKGLSRKDTDYDDDGKPKASCAQPSNLWDGKLIHGSTLSATQSEINGMGGTISGRNFSRILTSTQKQIVNDYKKTYKPYEISYKMVDRVIEILASHDIIIPKAISSETKNLLKRFYNSDESVWKLCKVAKFVIAFLLKNKISADDRNAMDIANTIIYENGQYKKTFSKIPEKLFKNMVDCTKKFYYKLEENMQKEKTQKFARTLLTKKVKNPNKEQINSVVQCIIDGNYNDAEQLLKKFGEDFSKDFVNQVDAYYRTNNFEDSNEKFVRYTTQRFHNAIAGIYATTRNYMPLLSKERLVKFINDSFLESGNVVHLSKLGIHASGIHKIILDQSFIPKAKRIAQKNPNPKAFLKALTKSGIIFKPLKTVINVKELHKCLISFEEFGLLPEIDYEMVIKAILNKSDVTSDQCIDIKKIAMGIISTYELRKTSRISIIDISAIVYIASKFISSRKMKIAKWKASGFSTVVFKICEFLGISTSIKDKMPKDEMYNSILIKERHRPIIDEIIDHFSIPENGRLLMDTKGDVDKILEFFVRTRKGITRICECRWFKSRGTYNIPTITIDEFKRFIKIVENMDCFYFKEIYAKTMNMSVGKGRIIQHFMIAIGVVNEISQRKKRAKCYQLTNTPAEIYQKIRKLMTPIKFAPTIGQLREYDITGDEKTIKIANKSMKFFKVEFLLKKMVLNKRFTTKSLSEDFFDIKFVENMLKILKIMNLIEEHDGYYTSNCNFETMNKIFSSSIKIQTMLKD
jgi:hypothetical protein